MPSHKEIVVDLIKVLEKDGTSEGRAGAAKGLGAAGGAEALTALRKAMNEDGTGQVRGAAAAAVGLIAGRGNAQDLIDQ